MEALFDSFIEFLKNQNNYVLYSILFISGIVENLFPPAPGDTITIFGAFLIGRNRLNFFYVYLLTTAGSSIGYMILFYLGKLVQKDYFLKKDFSFFSAESFNKVELWYEKYGYVLILANRFIPAVRSVTGIVAGILRLQVFKVFIYSLISLIIKFSF